jgi:hypothetical protein
VGLDAVHVDPENGCVDGVEFVDFITEIEGFPRSAGAVVFGIEIEHDPPSKKVLERDLLFVVRIEGKGGRFLSDFEHCTLLSRSDREVRKPPFISRRGDAA